MPENAQRDITRTERSGVLVPSNLARYQARWIQPAAAARAVVDAYWHVRWDLGDDVIDQVIVDRPAITVTVESGNVPAPLVVTGVSSGAWSRRISGAGAVFGIRLCPAGLAVLSDLMPGDVADATTALTPLLDRDLHAVAVAVAQAGDPTAMARAADAAVVGRLVGRGPTRAGIVANRVLDELSGSDPPRGGSELAQRVGVSERSVQRALAATLGHGPKWVARRIRIQAVAQAVAVRDQVDLAALAVELGYADQAHLTGDFRAVTGTTPGAYRRQLQRLAG